MGASKITQPLLVGTVHVLKSSSGVLLLATLRGVLGFQNQRAEVSLRQTLLITVSV